MQPFSFHLDGHQVAFVNSLNNLLLEAEEEIVRRVIHCASGGSNWPIGACNEVLLVAKLEYRNSVEAIVHDWEQYFGYAAVVEHHFGCLNRNGAGQDVYRDDLPELQQPYSYLLFDFLRHTEPGVADRLFEVAELVVSIEMKYCADIPVKNKAGEKEEE